MKRYCILILVFFFALSFKGQVVPGYQGRKNIIAYQISVMPEIFGPTYNNKVAGMNTDNYPKADESDFFVPFSFTHSMSYERVFKRKFSMMANYSFAASKSYLNFKQSISDPITNNFGDYYFNNIQMNVYGHYVTGVFVFYGQKALAPFGKYFKMSLGYAKMYSTFTEDIATSNNTYSNSNNAHLDTKNIYYGLDKFCGGISFGMNRIYKNRIVISRGISFFGTVKGDFDYDKIGVFSNMYKRLLAHDLLTFNLSIGYLYK